MKFWAKPTTTDVYFDCLFGAALMLCTCVLRPVYNEGVALGIYSAEGRLTKQRGNFKSRPARVGLRPTVCRELRPGRYHLS